MKITRSDAEFAAKVLGITASIDELTWKEVQAAYRTAVRAAHPDTSAEPSHDAADDIASFHAARNMLAEWIKWRPDPNCRICSGSGYNMSGTGFSSRPCPRCTKG